MMTTQSSVCAASRVPITNANGVLSLGAIDRNNGLRVSGTSMLPVVAVVDSGNVDCARCGDRGYIFSDMLRKSVRCPQCTERVRRISRREFVQLLTAVEARRRARMKLRAAALALIQRSETPPLTLDAELGPTHRIMLRWREKTGDGLRRVELADFEGEMRRRSHYPVLDDVTQIVIDQIVVHSPPHIDLFVREWYCINIPTHALMERRGICREQLYRELRGVLRYLRRHFEASKHADLLALVRAWL